MKSIRNLAVGALALGLSAAMNAQELNIKVPGNEQAAPKAPAAETAKSVALSEAQVIEALGWAIAQQAQFDMLKLSKEELASVQKGFSQGSQDKEAAFPAEKVGPVVDQWARKRFNNFIEELRKKGGEEAKQLPPPQTVEFDAAGFTDAQILESLGWFVGRQANGETNGMNQDQLSSLFRGMSLFSEGKDLEGDKQAIGASVSEFVRKRVEANMDRLRRKGQADTAAYFAKLKDNKSVSATNSGLRYEVISAGTGEYPKPSDTVNVTYKGTFIDGKVFDQGTTEFPLDRVIPGWTEGIQKINKGGKIRLHVPPQLGYGDDGNQGIPPASTLIFEVELHDFKATPGPASLGVGK